MITACDRVRLLTNKDFGLPITRILIPILAPCRSGNLVSPFGRYPAILPTVTLSENERLSGRGGPVHFQTTHWSVVLAAGREDSPHRAEALEMLCRTCWYPLYAHIRQHGHKPEDAQDLTQEFLARLLDKNWLADLSPHKGRFRTFLLMALSRFLINEYDHHRAIKRGGGKTPLSLDQEKAEGRFASEPFTNETPEQIFDRRWAWSVLDQALEHLRRESESTGRSRQFSMLQSYLSREAEPGEYAGIAEQLGLGAGALGVAVHRLRQRYREVVREVIANTISDPDLAREELQHLFASLRRPLDR